MTQQNKGIESVQTPMWAARYGGLPGADLVWRGLADLSNRQMTVFALLVQIGSPRLRNLGWVIPHAYDSPEYLLYDLLSQEGADSAHSRYNALIRTLVSFERAAECVNK